MGERERGEIFLTFNRYAFIHINWQFKRYDTGQSQNGREKESFLCREREMWGEFVLVTMH